MVFYTHCENNVTAHRMDCITKQTPMKLNGMAEGERENKYGEKNRATRGNVKRNTRTNKNERENEKDTDKKENNSFVGQNHMCADCRRIMCYKQKNTKKQTDRREKDKKKQK